MKNNVLSLALRKASRELGVDIKLVESVYKSYWKFAREHIENLPLKRLETEEEFNSLETNFSMPFIGKLYTNYERIEKYKYQKNKRNVETKENQANRLPGTGD